MGDVLSVLVARLDVPAADLLDGSELGRTVELADADESVMGCFLRTVLGMVGDVSGRLLKGWTVLLGVRRSVERDPGQVNDGVWSKSPT